MEGMWSWGIGLEQLCGVVLEGAVQFTMSEMLATYIHVAMRSAAGGRDTVRGAGIDTSYTE